MCYQKSVGLLEEVDRGGSASLIFVEPKRMLRNRVYAIEITLLNDYIVALREMHQDF
jgi:hypothetical protein